MKITEQLKATIDSAVEEARHRRHEYLTLEHLLYALCADPIALRILRGVGVDMRKLAGDLEAFFDEHMETLSDESEVDPTQTLAFWRVLQRAVLQAQGSGREKIDGGNVLISLLREAESHAVYLIQQQGVTRLDVLRFVSHGVTKAQMRPKRVAGPSERPALEDRRDDFDDEEAEYVGDPLEAYTVNLTQRAAEGLLDPLVGRVDELSLVIETLARRRKNNPVLVGDSGVGKTAIVEGLAQAVHDERVPDILEGAVIYSLDMGGLLAGTKFRGQFEERIKGVINAIVGDPKAILFIDEIHTIVGAGATSGGSVDASNLLKPALSTGQLRCIGSTTFPEYKNAFERDRALARRFQKIEIDEPSIEDTIEILRGLKDRYEEHHQVRFADEALEAASKLSAKYLNDRRLPDKAIDVIDQAGAVNRLKPLEDRLEELGIRHVEAVVAKMAKIPEKSVSASDQLSLARLDPELKKVIYGQDQAIEALVSAIKLSRAGLGTATKPIGCFLFAGPTGVGKTELARQLARVMGIELIRFDMSEYMEKHTVSRLIGAPPGYVGFDQGGLLTDAIRRTPYAVLLLDEIEKAHPDVFNILLQVMDHATLTDNNGRKADFRHVTLIMTTNAGGRDLSSQSMGFARDKEPSRLRSKSAIEKVFSPEFRNRLDAWIAFESLRTDSILKIVDKLVGELGEQLAEKDVSIELSEGAREWLAKEGYQPEFGARPMDRVIQRSIKKPLADRILFGDLKGGGRVRAVVGDDGLDLVKLEDEAEEAVQAEEIPDAAEVDEAVEAAAADRDEGVEEAPPADADGEREDETSDDPAPAAEAVASKT